MDYQANDSGFIRKVIRASAGTGKTYRLSLEYLALLIKYQQRGIKFNEILVLTFTQKATAEIRERIFSHLESIVTGDSKRVLLIRNLYEIFGITMNDQDLAMLRTVYHEMLANKQQVQIKTIDSFINYLFKTVIAPYLGLSYYEIVNDYNDRTLQELYRAILEDPKDLQELKSFFRRSARKKRRIQDYERFVKSIVEQRWFFYFTDLEGSSSLSQPKESSEINEFYKDFVRDYLHAAHLVQRFVMQDRPEFSSADVLKAEYYRLVAPNEPTFPSSEIVHRMQEHFREESKIADEYPTWLKNDTFWNRTKIFKSSKQDAIRQEALNLLQAARQSLVQYLFHQFLLPEQQHLRHIADKVLQRYEEIKFRDKSFTHNDISFFSLQNLYKPELSLIEGDSVSNAFYEVLASRYRFILIDEFQDTSIVQYKILLPIIREVISGWGAKEYGGVILVGDEKQSIYGWRGGERDLLLRMPEILGGVIPDILNTNYRSRPLLIEKCNEIFSHPILHDWLKLKEIEWPYQPVQCHHSEAEPGLIEIHIRQHSSSEKDEIRFSKMEEVLREFTEQEIIPTLLQDNSLSHQSAVLARKNDHLQSIAAVLDENGIPYILQSSYSITQHRAVKPILYLFNYLSYGDLFHLLQFFRSDWTLMDSAALKKIVLTYRDRGRLTLPEMLRQLADIPEVAKLLHFLDEYPVQWRHAGNLSQPALINPLLNFTIKLFEEYNVTDTFNLENDAKNLQLFLEIIADFENARPEYTKTLPVFLKFCEEYENREEFRQKSLQDAAAVQLLTIHKAKGLEFEQVFLHWHLDNRESNDYDQLRTYWAYQNDFSCLNDHLLTYNFDDILQNWPGSKLYQQTVRRRIVEQLNTLYVALTRAKSRLTINFAYESVQDLVTYLDDDQEPGAKKVDFYLLKTLFEIINQTTGWQTDGAGHHFVRQGHVTGNSAQSSESALPVKSYLAEYLNPARDSDLSADPERLEKERYVDFRNVYLEQRAPDRGNVAHFYLSFILYNTEAERAYALQRTIAFFGNLVAVADISGIIRQVDRALEQHPDYFSAAKWNKVFTEQAIYTPEGRQFRLDRLMIDEKNREIMIIDYKTGLYHEAEQMENYITAVAALPVVKRHDYRIMGSYLELF